MLTTFRDMTFEHLSKLPLTVSSLPYNGGYNLRGNPISSAQGKEDSKIIFYCNGSCVNLLQVLKRKPWERQIHRQMAGKKVKGAK